MDPNLQGNLKVRNHGGTFTVKQDIGLAGWPLCTWRPSNSGTEARRSLVSCSQDWSGQHRETLAQNKAYKNIYK